MTDPCHNVAEAILTGGDAASPALWHGREVVTYGQLREMAAGWTARLRHAGLTVGDRVGLFAENSPFWVAAYLGTIRAGFCVVPFQVDCSDSTFQRIVTSTGMRQLVVSQRFLPRVAPLAERLGLPLAQEPASLDQGDGCPTSAAAMATRDLAAIMFTSGSTGEPKGVMVTHRNIECNTRDIVDYLGLTANDRVMAVLPFYYCYGVSLLHTHLLAGGSLVLNNRFMFPEKVLDEMVEKQCTGLAGVPSTYQILLRKTHFARRTFPALRWFQQAGGKLPNAFLREIREAFPAVRLFVMYGQTEGTARLSYLPPERLDDKLGSVGRGLPNTHLDIVRADGAAARPGSDDVGEIIASGDNITPGYWNDPEETARYFRSGRLMTGDMARIDKDGFIFIVERARDFIKAMGNRVSPKEIEEVLAEMPEVVEAAVLGVPDELWGEAVKAFLVTAQPEQLTAAKVLEHCRKRLPNFKIPQYVEFLPRLPKTANGKVAKEELRKVPASGGTAHVV
jgi:acyl-CoA synthetase (AMP-forming)/AMP-acid ligase II